MSLVFAFVGSVGSVLTMILALVAAVIVGLYVLSYAAHSLLTVVENTGAGCDEVRWPDIPLPDWIGRGIFLAILLMVWLAPSAILSQSLSRDWLEDNAPMRFALLAVPGVWLFLPIGLLSSMSSTSRWIMFRISIVGVMLRVLPSTLMFYLLSGGVVAGAALLWYTALFKEGGLPLVLLAGPLSAVAVLLYGRLLGRLALMIHRKNPSKKERDAWDREERQKKKKKRRKSRPDSMEEETEVDGVAPETGAAPAADAEDQALAIWAAEPRHETPDDDEEAEELELADESDPDLDLPAPLSSEEEVAPTPENDDEFPLKPLERDEKYDNRWKEEVDDGPADPYSLSREAPARAPEYHRPEEDDFDDMGPRMPEEKRTGDGIVTHIDKPPDRVKKRRRKAPPPAPMGPSAPWLQGVYTFPFYPTSLNALVWMWLGFTVFGFLCGLVTINYAG